MMDIRASAFAVCGIVLLHTVNAGGEQMRVTSPLFGQGREIPVKYSCMGENASPTLKIEGVPEGAKSLALIVDDPDAPMQTPFKHWVMYNIPPDTREIAEGTEPGTAGKNTMGKNGYMAPCPPSGTHRYFFRVYALDTVLTLDPQLTDSRALEAAMEGHVIGSAELMGTMTRQ